MTPSWYPPGLPQWDGSDSPSQPSINNNKGYDVTAVQFPEERRSQAYQTANATLSDGTAYWPLFVNDVQIDIGLAGTTAQAQLTRDFYPHNMVMPSFTVQGQALDQRDYGDLCEFVHRAQLASVSGGLPLLQLWVNGMGINGTHGASDNAVTVQSKAPNLASQDAPNQKLRGFHKTLTCQGYINTMPRQHQKGVVSPTYSFTFVVAEMIKGPWTETLADAATQKSWIDMLKATSAEDFASNHSTLWNNWWILNWAKKNQLSVFTNS